MLVLDADYPRWNTRNAPSPAGLAFLRALDELSFGAADVPDDAVFVDELDLPRRSEDEPGCAPDYGVLTADRLWIIELKTERGSHRSGQVESYFELGRHHYPDARVDLTYLTPGDVGGGGGRAEREPVRAGDVGAGDAAHRRGLVGRHRLDARAPRRAGETVASIGTSWTMWREKTVSDLTAPSARLAKLTAQDGQERALDYAAGSLGELQELRLAVRDEFRRPESRLGAVTPWLWDAATSGGQALTEAGRVHGYELRFSRKAGRGLNGEYGRSMVMFDAVTQDHVRQAIDECDEVGADAFLRRYGFGHSRHYVLWNDGRAYDPVAILGVAQRYATGTAARSSEFSDGKQGAALVLRELGPRRHPRPRRGGPAAAPLGERRLAGRLRDRHWTPLAPRGPAPAREILIEVAGHYNALVTFRELAGLVQLRSGIRTNQLVHYWVGDVLARVARVCADRDEPLLSALCVNASGSVGAGYAKAVVAVRGELEGDPDDHAATERLACYRAFGARPPRGRRQPALTPQVAAVRDRERARRSTKPQVEATVCPTCNMAIPATGICDNCG